MPIRTRRRESKRGSRWALALLCAGSGLLILLTSVILMPLFGWEVRLGSQSFFGMRVQPQARWPYGPHRSSNGPTYSLRIGDWVWVIEGDERYPVR
jgi:hypothetical protein